MANTAPQDPTHFWSSTKYVSGTSNPLPHLHCRVGETAGYSQSSYSPCRYLRFPFHRPSSYGLPIPIDRGLNSLPFALTQSTNALHRPLFTNYSAINPQQDSLADHSSSTYLTNLPYTCTIQLRTLTKNEAQNLTLDAIIAMKLITSILSSLGIGMLALNALAGGATIPPTPTTLAAKSHDSRSEKRDTPWKCTKNRDGLEICKDGSCVQGPRCGEHQISLQGPLVRSVLVRQ